MKGKGVSSFTGLSKSYTIAYTALYEYASRRSRGTACGSDGDSRQEQARCLVPRLFLLFDFLRHVVLNNQPRAVGSNGITAEELHKVRGQVIIVIQGEPQADL